MGMGRRKRADCAKVEAKIYREVHVSGFSHLDHEIAFFTQVAALITPETMALDFGAGRGEWFHDDPSPYRRSLMNLKGRCRHVDGVDVDPVVLANPTLDAAAVTEIGERLPFEDGRFDIVIARYVFEHVTDPVPMARELLRVTKPGGWICALTPNKWGYVALVARLVPNRLHQAILARVQPHRLAEDVFPTAYRLNTPGAVRKAFGADVEVYYYRSSALPSYHFGNAALFRLQNLLHRFLPPPLDVRLSLFIRKKRNDGSPVELAR
jgi:SAM-dependent methyltransferase